MRKVLRVVFTITVFAVLVVAGYVAYQRFLVKTERVRFNTQPVVRGSLASSISATGTVEPEELVNVGAQIGGMVTEFGPDVEGKPVDYGSRVTSGMVLARIDDALYDAAFREAKAQKQQAEASILSARANIEQAKAKQELAESNWERAQELYPKKAMSKSDYDSAVSELANAKAQIAVSDASLAQAEASLAIANAALDKAERNLGYCVISSPVDGVIIDRRVSIGQTVNASMNAPSLFLIAKDLRKMQVWVSVNEADVGEIKPGMEVEFTVDAFPQRTFLGTVHKIRLNATMSQNVVTYVVEVAADNSDGTLLPYLTANVKFILARRDNVLSVTNAALRYTPEPTHVPLRHLPAYEESQKKRHGAERLLWTLDDNGMLSPVKVTIGLNDGVATEIVAGELQDGMAIVTGASVVTGDESAATGGDAGSPFLPKPPKRR